MRLQLVSRDDHRLAIGDRRLAPEDVDPLRAVGLHLPGIIQPADHVVAVLRELPPARRGHLEPGDATCRGARLRRPQKRLARDARPVGALAAD